MEVKNRPIKKKNYLIQLVLFILHLGIIIYFIFTLKPSQFLPHLTNWSFVLSSFYLLSVLAWDTFLYFYGSNKLEKFNHFIRNSYSNIVYPYCFLISIGFWVILLIGFISPAETFLEKDQEITIEMIIINTYVHLCITAIMIVDLCFNQRDKTELNWCSNITNTIIYIIYIITVCIEKYIFDFYPYLFLKDLNVGLMIIVAIIIYALLIASIFIYNALTNKINRKFMKIKERGEDEKLIVSGSEGNSYSAEEN